ncbi:unnamed protein product [Peronospora belbahrii]|uniref:Uncharacterized protein n=1 Tax=Peronospora belbahrii TaxID=622444 RepID=A0ABN8CLK0_9STRA|nr:unnamed protein product [Peronospora belbahrii]
MLFRADTIDDALMSGGTTDAVPCLSSDDVAAALREQLARNGGVYALLRTGHSCIANIVALSRFFVQVMLIVP